MPNWCCIAAVNDDDVLAANLAASPMLVTAPTRLITLRDQPNAGTAYNAGLDASDARICIFAHQDVYLPEGWDNLIDRRLAELDALDPNWAVAGPYGVSQAGPHAGRVWSSGIGREIGTSPPTPVPAQSLDELVIILNRDSGLRFDPDLPSFHLYGTDIVQAALAAGQGVYVIDAPVVHNSRPVVSLRGGFTEAYRYARRKWRHRLPIRTPVTHLSFLGLKHLRQIMRNRNWRRPEKTAPRPPGSTLDPAEIARRLGYE